MIVLKLPAGKYPALSYDRDFTYAGILEHFFSKTDELGRNIGLSKKWNDITAAKYSRDYTERLLPILVSLFGREKPIHMYTESDFIQILEKLDTQYQYAPSTMDHYRYLLWIVYKAGFEAGLYDDNIFWGELIDPLTEPEEYEKHRANALTRIRKSFSIEEDIRLMKWFLTLNPITASGTDVGLACMYFLGCRNNESCGANFDAFHTLNTYPQIPVFDMLQTTELGSNQLKASGKTSNAPRILPVPIVFYHFICMRKAWLQQQVDTGKLILPPSIHSVNQLPIACVGTEYTRRAQTSDLSRAGRSLFQKIGIGKSELAVLQQILSSSDFKDTQIAESEPTTYLLRRNVATRLYHLSFRWECIQYWIAHEIENTLLLRNDFTDEDTLCSLSLQYAKHPIFNVLKTEGGVADPHDTEIPLSINQKSNVLIQIVANEPNQAINLNAQCSGAPVKITLTELTTQSPFNDTVDILSALYSAYQTKLLEMST